MRTMFVALMLAAAAGEPSLAQTTQFELDSLRIQQEALARRAVAQTNELMALEARLKTEQAIADLRAQTNPPRVPELSYTPTVPASSGAALAFPSIPDAALADSNRRVRAITQPKP